MSVFSSMVSAEMLVYITVCLLFLIYLFNGSKRSAVNMPPGPRPLPLIGNLHMLDLKKPFNSLMKMSEKYGDVFTVHFGPKKVVVLAGYKTVKEALANQADDFGGRAGFPVIDIIMKGNGIVLSHGESWKVMRRFALSTLRDFGMGKKTIESRIQDELNPLIEHFKSHNGKPFDVKIIINSAVSNVICSIIFGDRFEYDDPIFLSLIKLTIENIQMSGTPLAQLYNSYPGLGSFIGADREVIRNMTHLYKLIEPFIQRHRQEFNASNITGFIDAFLMKQEQESSQSNTQFHNDNLLNSILDLFVAGSETTSTTLYWGLLLMMKYPEIQKKVQEEIEMCIKPGQMPSVEDRKNMPYTEAVIHEIQRFANIIPLNVPHATTKDVYFRGYFIPKDTEVIPFLTSVLYDKSQWKTPYKFNPQHFLDTNGRFIKQDAFMPFSIDNKSGKAANVRGRRRARADASVTPASKKVCEPRASRTRRPSLRDSAECPVPSREGSCSRSSHRSASPYRSSQGVTPQVTSDVERCRRVLMQSASQAQGSVQVGEVSPIGASSGSGGNNVP